MNVNTFPEQLIVDYIYPLFRASTKKDLVNYMSYGTILYGICTFFSPIDFPYGKLSAKWAGFGVPVRLAWFLQELPSFLIPLVLALFRFNTVPFNTVSNIVLLGMFLLHYFQRTFVYTALMRSNQPTPFLPFIAAFFTTAYNGILHGVYFTSFQSYSDTVWLSQPCFYVGMVFFALGMSINIHSDSILRNLRKGTSKGYKIPKGGMFRYVSCGNYFGEILEMFGYAIASWSLPATAFSIFVLCFLTRRAIQTHRWYLKKFESYPKNRKAVIPFII